MKFDFKAPLEGKALIKCSTHKDGKLGFSSGAADFLDLSNNRFFKVALNAEDKEDMNIYMLHANEGDENAFKVSKAGVYFFLRVKHILDELDINYQEERNIYDIIKVEDGELKYYKLKPRKAIGRRK